MTIKRLYGKTVQVYPVMNKSLILAAAFLMLSGACAPEGISSSKPGAGEEKELNISVGRHPETATESAKPSWSKGEAIGVFDGTALRRFEAAASAEICTFSGKAESSDNYTLYYPYEENAACDADGANAHLNPEQKAVKGLYDVQAAPLAGEYRSGSNGATLRLACAFVSCDVPTDSRIKTLRVSCNGQGALSGKFKIRLENRIPVVAGISEGVSHAEISDGGKTLEPGTYNIAVLPGTYSQGLKLEAQDENGEWSTVSQTEGEVKLDRAASLPMFATSDPDKPEIEEEPDDTSADPASSFGFDYAALAKSGHPRLFIRADELESYKRRVLVEKNPDDYVYLLHTKAMVMAQNQVNTTDEIKHELADGKRMLSYSMIAVRRMFSCSYAYMMSGEKRYLDRVRKDLATILTFPDWNPSHYLDVGEMSLAVAIAYDWLYYDLTLDERTRTHAMLKDYALGTYKKDGYLRSVSNWNQVCNAGITAAALVLYEKDKAVSAEAVETGVASNLAACASIYNPDGNTHEGYSYWAYGTDFQVLLLQMLDAAFGKCGGIDEIEGLRKTGEYILYMGGPVGTFSYADGGSDQKTKSRISQWWLASHFNQPANLCQEIAGYKAGKYNTPSDRLYPSVPLGLFRNPVDIVEGQFPTAKLWTGGGLCPVAIIRSGWTGTASDIHAGLKGGGTATTHSHMDAGSFMFDSKGIRWSEDLSIGTYATYEHAFSDFWSLGQSSRRWDVLRANNLLHSTIAFENSDGTVAGKLHVTDQKAGESYAVIKGIIENSTEVGATMDLSAVYPDQVKSAVRTLKLVNNKDLVIIDEIEAKSGMDAIMQWRMLTSASITPSKAFETLTKAGCTLYISTRTDASDVAAEYTSWNAERPENWQDRGWDTSIEPDNSFYGVAGWTATVPAGRKVTFTTTLSFDKPQ